MRNHTLKTIIAAGFAGITSASCGIANWTREVNLSGDQKPAISTIDSGNPAIKLELVISTPEFKVYRFIDAGHTRYVAVRAGGQVSMMSTAKHGKNEFVDTSIATVP